MALVIPVMAAQQNLSVGSLFVVGSLAMEDTHFALQASETYGKPAIVVWDMKIPIPDYDNLPPVSLVIELKC